jgi:hypothetical protein
MRRKRQSASQSTIVD